MNRWTLCTLIGAGVACATANGVTNVIVQHNRNLVQGRNYTIYQPAMQVTIILGVEGEMPLTGAIAIDWDGDQHSDKW